MERAKNNTARNAWVLLSVLLMAVQSQAGALEDVRNQFNKDKGVPRLVVLVSPT
jgi:hypothetical protein